MQNPLDLTRGDLAGLMEAGQTIADAANVTGNANPLGGIGEILNTVERGFGLWDQFNKRMAESGMILSRLRSAEQLGIDPPDQGGFFPPGPIIEGNVYRPPTDPVTLPTPDEPEPPPGPQPKPTETIEPIKLYSTMLGYLSKLADPNSPFKDLTLGDALELARANKTLVLGAIEEELPKILGTNGRPDE